MPSNSPRLSLNALDLWKTARGAILLALGLFAVHGLEGVLADLTSGAIDLGKYGVLRDLLGLVLGSVIELLRRYVRHNP